MNKTEIYKTALNSHDIKTKEQHKMAKMFAESSPNIGLTTADLRQLKDYAHYRGMGWIDGNPLTKEKSELFPDRVSTKFRGLLKVIETSARAGKLDDLNVYIEAMKQHGINISFDKKILPKVKTKNVELLNKTIDKGSAMQGVICQNADIIKFELAPIAEESNICPKKKFKELVAMKYAVNNKKRCKKIQQEKTFTKMFGSALKTDLKPKMKNKM